MWESETLRGRILAALSAPTPPPPPASSGIIREVQLPPEAAKPYSLEPEEQLGAWLQAVEPLSPEGARGPGRSWVRAGWTLLARSRELAAMAPGLLRAGCTATPGAAGSLWEGHLGVSPGSSQVPPRPPARGSARYHGPWRLKN